MSLPYLVMSYSTYALLSMNKLCCDYININIYTFTTKIGRDRCENTEILKNILNEDGERIFLVLDKD